MKKYSLAFIFGFGIFAMSCADQYANKELSVEKNEYMINIDDEYYDIIYNDNGYSLNDLDFFYKKIKKTRTQEKNYNNLRKIIINTMYLSKDLLKVEDKSVLQYYVNELISMPYISDMEMFYNMLGGLINHLGNDKVREIATIIVQRNIKYINENFPNPAEVHNLPQQKSGTQSMYNLMALE